jgi:serine/threonine protein kinase
MSLFDKRYSYVKELGAGGFGKVFLAIERVSNRLVAIKQLLNTNKLEQEDIINELEIVSKFENQNIVTYYHHFREDDKLFLVMEYCSGGSLRDKMNSSKISTSDALLWIQTLTTCLRTAQTPKSLLTLLSNIKKCKVWSQLLSGFCSAV